MNITAKDIFKSVLSALVITFITFLVNLFIEATFKRFDVSIQRTTFLEKVGYLIQFDNPTTRTLDAVKIVATRRHIDSLELIICAGFT